MSLKWAEVRAQVHPMAAAEALHLLPPRGKGMGAGVRLWCPECGVLDGPTKATMNADTGAWQCKVEGTHRGGATDLQWRWYQAQGGRAAEVPSYTPPTTTQADAAPDAEVQQALAEWRALPEGAEALRRWASSVRQWPAEVAEAVPQVPGLAWCPPYHVQPQWARRQWERTPGRYPVRLPMADADGTVWTCEGRQAAQWDDDKPKTMSLRTGGQRRGRYFGSIPEAVRSAACSGLPLLLVEGSADYIGAVAALGLPTIGTPGCNGLPHAAEAIARHVTEAQVRGRVRVVVVPHIDKPKNNAKHGAGMAAALQAASSLAGRVPVHLATLPLPQGDVADLLRIEGAEALRALVRDAPMWADALPHIEDADAGARLQAAVAEAVAADVGRLVVLQVPPGAGKTRAACVVAAEAAAQGRAVALALPTLALAAEKAAELADLQALGEAADVPVHIVRGQAAQCELLRDATDDETRTHIGRGLQAIGRSTCAGCPQASRAGGTCHGWQPPNVPPGAVTIMAHAAVPQGIVADVAILDELPQAVAGGETTPAHLRSMVRHDFASAQWRDAHPAHCSLAAELARVLDVMAAEVQGEHPVRLPLPDLRARLAAEVPHFPALAADVAAEDAEPPRPAPRDVRAGVAHRWPDLGAWHIVREIAQVVRAYQGSKSHGSRAGASSSPPQVLHLRLTPGASWAIETRTVWTLPPTVGHVVGLDGTADASAAEWQVLAASARRVLDVRRLDVAGQTAEALHYRTTRLAARRLFTRAPSDDGTPARAAVLGQAVGAMRNAVMRACGEAPCVVGILTHRVMAEVLRWGIRLAHDPNEPQPRCLLPDDVHARAIAEDVARIIGLGWELRVGWYGAHTVASNRFDGVQTMALLGSPRPDFGAAAADAEVLGIELATFYRGRTMAAAAQGLARGRHLRRPGVRLLYAADDLPPSLPGVTWRNEVATHAAAPHTPASTGARRVVQELAERWGALDAAEVAEVLRWAGLGHKASAVQAQAVAADLGWRRWPVRTGTAGRPRMVWALDAAAAAWGLDAVRVDATDLRQLLQAVGLGLQALPDDDAAQVVRAYQGSKSHGSRAGASSSPRTSSSTDMAVHVVPNEVHPGGAIEVHPADVDVHADPRTAPRRARAG